MANSHRARYERGYDEEASDEAFSELELSPSD